MEDKNIAYTSNQIKSYPGILFINNHKFLAENIQINYLYNVKYCTNGYKVQITKMVGLDKNLLMEKLLSSVKNIEMKIIIELDKNFYKINPINLNDVYIPSYNQNMGFANVITNFSIITPGINMLNSYYTTSIKDV